jgi:RNA polymerase sigma-70 factor (ECF subfamily)
VTKTLERTAAPPTLDDDALMARVATGDSQALAALYERHSRAAFGLTMRMLSSAEDAEDVLQEAFWRVWQRSATYQQGRGNFAPWLFGIVRNLCIDELRRRQSRPSKADGGDEALLHGLPDLGSDVHEEAWQLERRRTLRTALAQLPADQRQAIELAYFGGLSQREIAEQLDSPLGTVKTRIRMAIQKLHGLLHPRGFDSETL